MAMVLRVSPNSLLGALAIFFDLPGLVCAGIDRIVPWSNPHKCLDLEHGQTKNGNRLVLWDCWDTDRQRWSVGSKQITLQNDTTKCIDFWGLDPKKNAEDGNALQVWDCHERREHHEWHFRGEDSTIRWKTPGGEEKCIDLFNHNTDNGAEVGVWECNGSPQQRWALGDGTGASFIYYDVANKIVWIVSVAVLSVALCASLSCNCLQRHLYRKSTEERTNLTNPTINGGTSITGVTVGSPTHV
jgi:hypothetical protein